jgi:HEAT repeat protein
MSLLPHRAENLSYEVRAALARYGADAAPAVPTLLALLEQARADGKIGYHQEIVDVLAKIGPPAVKALPLLIDLLNESRATPSRADLIRLKLDPFMRESTIMAVARIGIDSPDTLQVLRAELKNASPYCRSAAVLALARVARSAPVAFADLIDILSNDQAEGVRANAALAIADMSGDRREAVPQLTAALNDASPDVRMAAATALSSFGPLAQSALPALQQDWQEARCGIPRPPARMARSQSTALHIRLAPPSVDLPLAATIRKAVIAIDSPAHGPPQ